MLAALVEGPGKLSVREVTAPVISSDYDVLCELLYGATCSATDQHLIAGVFPWPPASYPAVLGHESIGRAVAVGAKVRHIHKGDLITRVGTPPMKGEYEICWGGFAEYGIAHDWQAMKEDGLPESQWAGRRVERVLPADTDPRAATMVITWRETWSFLSRIRVQKDAKVLVLGSGGNGLAFVSHARNLGAGLVAMTGSARREQLARRAGASAYVDYRSEDLASRLGQICPDGFDLVIDAVGTCRNLDLALPCLRPGGGVAMYGVNEVGHLAIDPGKARGPFTVYPNQYDEAEAHEAILALWRSGKLDASLWLDVDHPEDLRNIDQAYDALRRGEVVKSLIRLHA